MANSSPPPPPPPSSKTPPQKSTTTAPTPKKIPLGEFRNGNWYCECPGGRYARLLRGKREGPNQGKQFYGCHTHPDQGNHCNFWLSLEDAQKRERECFVSNHRSEGLSPINYRQTTLLESIGKKGKEKEKEKEKETEEGIASTSAVQGGGAALEPGLGDVSSPIIDLTEEEEEEEEEGEGVGVDSPTKSRGNGSGNGNGKENTMSQLTGKRKRPANPEVDLLDDLSSDAEAELIAVSEKPNKRYDALKSIHGTPSVSRTTDVGSGLPTPSRTRPTGRGFGKGLSFSKDLFENGGASKSNGPSSTLPEAKRQRLDSDGHNRGKGKGKAPNNDLTATQLFGTSATIDAPASFASSVTMPNSTFPRPTQSFDSGDLMGEVMDLLKGEKISDALRKELRNTLDRHVVRTNHLKAKVEELQDLTARLEELRKTTRTGLMDLYQTS
ncbi:hypothetical protein GGS20DRAFT_589725 [Poronia punctata]|nr:hypothetical protein GGS20DRAFT_589725 [Poronia punctata]